MLRHLGVILAAVGLIGGMWVTALLAGLLFSEWPALSLVVLLVIALPTIAVVFATRKQRLRQRLGLCLRCGYNLTGNASGICPVCETPVLPPGAPGSPAAPCAPSTRALVLLFPFYFSLLT